MAPLNNDKRSSDPELHEAHDCVNFYNGLQHSVIIWMQYKEIYLSTIWYQDSVYSPDIFNV